MRVQRADLHLLTGAYVVDALTGAELAEFERHLYRCGSCAEEVRGLRETTARLGMAAAIAPPPEMRPQVLAAVTRMRQLPPSARTLPGHGAPRKAPRLRRALPRPVTTVAMAAMVAAIVVLSVLQVRTRHQLQQAQAGNRVAAAVLAAPDARLETGGTTLGGTMTAVISPHDREAVITTVGMPVPSGTRVYQLWVISAAGARSAGLLPSSSNGATSPVLAADVQPGDKLAITVEPAGGTTQPTTTPVVLLTAHA
ncbi:MAG: Anti-sigma-K factor RskA [Actinomycetia bacterium]|nr:Anti-sigma-K factor RskA [Actinomycetes bacterium]